MSSSEPDTIFASADGTSSAPSTKVWPRSASSLANSAWALYTRSFSSWGVTAQAPSSAGIRTTYLLMMFLSNLLEVVSLSSPMTGEHRRNRQSTTARALVPAPVQRAARRVGQRPNRCGYVDPGPQVGCRNRRAVRLVHRYHTGPGRSGDVIVLVLRPARRELEGPVLERQRQNQGGRELGLGRAAYLRGPARDQRLGHQVE